MAHVYVVTDYANLQRPSYKTLINLPGSPSTPVAGTLTAIAIVGGQGYHYFRATIDNNLLMSNQGQALCGGGRWMHNSIGLNLPFHQNLKVEIADHRPSMTPVFWVSCFVSGCDMIKRGQPTRREIDGINFAYRTDLFQTETGEQYEVDYSSGVWSLSEVSLDVDAYRAGRIKLRGWIKVSERSEDNPDDFVGVSCDDVVLVCRPVGESEE